MTKGNDSLRVLLIHNAYKQFGGEDGVFEREANCLYANGHNVLKYCVTNDTIHGFWHNALAAVGCVFSLSSYIRVRRVIQYFRPDVVHVHNFFPLLSPSVFYACRAEKVPVTFTLHNFRIICPTALLLWRGEIAERSLRHGPWWALPRRVYRGSFVGTFFLCLMIGVHRRIGTWRRDVDAFIALTDFSRSKFVEGGLPPGKVHVKPNFVRAGCCGEYPRAGLVFVGRLSPEKGIAPLLGAAERLAALEESAPETLDVVGDGPLQEEVRACRRVRMLGAMNHTAVVGALPRYVALVIPSICYEGMPLTVLEAFAAATPVIASRIGSLAEMVEDGVTGLLVEPGNERELADKMAWALTHQAEMAVMGRAARREYEAKYTEAASYRALMGIYRHVIVASARTTA